MRLYFDASAGSSGESLPLHTAVTEFIGSCSPGSRIRHLLKPFMRYMIENGQPYYHLAEPNIEAEAQSEVDVLLCRTALGHTLAF